jgi:hypothetical protein
MQVPWISGSTNLDCAGRSGKRWHDGPVAGVYATSDVHGYVDDLRAGLAEVGLLDGDRWVGGDDRLWVLGDLTDRGPDGIGVVRLVRDLQRQAPEQVRVLMGNHEALALGRHLFPDTRFGPLWAMNGGHERDQEALTEEDVAWLRELPVLGLDEGFLLAHSDTDHYLKWGESVETINATVHELLAGDEYDDHWSVFAGLSGRYDFAGTDGAAAAASMLGILGGQVIVHGHSIIGSLVGSPSWETEAPIQYADRRVVAIDGGRYDGGPLLVVKLV